MQYEQLTLLPHKEGQQEIKMIQINEHRSAVVLMTKAANQLNLRLMRDS